MRKALAEIIHMAAKTTRRAVKENKIYDIWTHDYTTVPLCDNRYGIFKTHCQKAFTLLGKKNNNKSREERKKSTIVQRSKLLHNVYVASKVKSCSALDTWWLQAHHVFAPLRAPTSDFLTGGAAV